MIGPMRIQAHQQQQAAGLEPLRREPDATFLIVELVQRVDAVDEIEATGGEGRALRPAADPMGRAVGSAGDPQHAQGEIRADAQRNRISEPRQPVTAAAPDFERAADPLPSRRCAQRPLDARQRMDGVAPIVGLGHGVVAALGDARHRPRSPTHRWPPAAHLWLDRAEQELRLSSRFDAGGDFGQQQVAAHEQLPQVGLDVGPDRSADVFV